MPAATVPPYNRPMPHARLLLSVLLLLASSASAQQLAITVDDLPAHGDLPPAVTRAGIAQSFVDAFKSRHVPPVYGFINGHEDEDPDTHAVFDIWRRSGNLLGSHTWSHPDINDVTGTEFTEDIQKNEPLLLRYMSQPPYPAQDWHWFRYPFLHEGDTLSKRRQVRSWLTEHGYRVAEVNMDFEDYLWNEPYARCVVKHDEKSIRKLHDTYLATADTYQRYFRRLSRLTYGGDVKYILLMHIGAFDAKMLPELLDLYKRRGYTFITLEAAEKDSAYRANPDMADPSGGTLMEQVLARKQKDFPDNPPKPEKLLDGICR